MISRDDTTFTRTDSEIWPGDKPGEVSPLRGSFGSSRGIFYNYATPSALSSGMRAEFMQVSIGVGSVSRDATQSLHGKPEGLA